MVGLRQIRTVQRDDITGAQKLAEVNPSCAELSLHLGSQGSRTGVDHRHPEGLGASSHRDADGAGAHNAEHLALNAAAE